MSRYTIQPGDTFSSIARNNGLTLQQLLSANPSIANPNQIQVGQTITVPGQSSTASSDPSNSGSSVDASDADIDAMARTILGEARGESEEGKIAVGWVILNRTLDGHFASTVYDVCHQPSQFSCWNAGDPNRSLISNARPGDPAFDACMDAAQRVMSGNEPDPTNGATFYYAPNKSNPAWAANMDCGVQIGAHRFCVNLG